MRNGESTSFLSNFNQTARNQRPRNTGTQQILTFINSVGAKHGEYIVGDEIFGDVFDIDFFHAHGFGFFTGWFNLFTLADIRSKRYNFCVVSFLQPATDD